MTRLSPRRYPWTRLHVLGCSVVVAATYLAVKALRPLSGSDSAGAALAVTAVLAAAFVVPPLLILLARWKTGARRYAAADAALPRKNGDTTLPCRNGDTDDDRQRPLESSDRRVPIPPNRTTVVSPLGLWFPAASLPRDVIAGLVLGLLLAVMNGISMQLGTADDPGRAFQGLAGIVFRSSGMGDVSTLLLALGLVAPVAEEVFFRGVLYPGLRRRLPAVPSVVVSAAIFGAAHYDPMCAHAFLLGVVAAILVEYTGSLVPAILAHMGVNIGFVLFLANGARLTGRIPLWGLVTAFLILNVLLFLLGQQLFGRMKRNDEG